MSQRVHTERAELKPEDIKNGQHNRHLNTSKKNRNDEFYTYYEDIAQELDLYPEAFKGAAVWLPFDNVEASNFWKYFHDNFQKLGLKALYSTAYGQKFIAKYTGGNDSKIDVFEQMEISGDGDYKSDDFEDLRDEADMIVANPPFSLYGEILEKDWFMNKKLFLVGPLVILLRKPAFDLLTGLKLFVGRTRINRFMGPDGTLKAVNTVWLTTEHATVPKPEPEPEQEPETLDDQYKGHDVAWCPKVEDIETPSFEKYDYYAVPISYALKYRFDDPIFEVVDMERAPKVNGKKKIQPLHYTETMT